ncbi:targeting protein for Xklp2 [Aulostomus maculatus]
MAEGSSGDTARRYEFDAPSHVVDFKQLETTESDDTWFDQQSSGQDSYGEIPFGPDEPLDVARKPRAVIAPLKSSNKDIVPSTSLAAGDSTNGGARPKPSTKTTAQNKPRRVSKRKGERSSSPPPPMKKQKNSSNQSSVSAKDQGGVHTRKLRSKAANGKAAKTRSSQATTSSNVDHSEEPSSSARDMNGSRLLTSARSSRGKKVGKAATYVPVAQHIMQLENRTPERFHLRSRQNRERGPSRGKSYHLALTQPRSPNLWTKQRRRPPTVKSSAEMEAEEAEELKKMKFKAQELNRKILESTECLKKPVVKAPTLQEAFTLHVEKRLQERQITRPHDDEMQHTFKAQEMPKKILEGVVGVPEKRVLQPTVPESPAFLLKKRTRMEHKVEEVKPPAPIKPLPVPHFGLPFKPLPPEKHVTEVQPFSFEQREQEKRMLREQKVEEKPSEEVLKFKAQLLPHFETVVLPERKKVEPTKPEPFRLLVDERGVAKCSRWEQTMKEEQKKLKEVATFKARPNTVTHKAPFQPKKEDRAPVAADSFELATERRARERQEFEQLASEKEAFRAQMEEERRREEEQQEKDEIARLRQEQVHKANPIRLYKSVDVKKSEVPLTVPKSPNFSDRFRL